MNVALTTDRFVAEASAGIHHNSKEQHSLSEFRRVFAATHIHSDCVYRVGPSTIRITKAGPNCVK